MGWPLRARAKYREFGGSFIYPMGDDMLTIGMVVGLDYRDAELSVHDLLQELKTNPFVRKMLEGGERIAWGAKTIPEGGFVALPKRLHAPGLLLCGDGAGMVNVPALKGIHYAVESGRLAAEAVVETLGLAHAVDAWSARRLRRRRAEELHLERSQGGAQHAPGVRQRLLPRRDARRGDDRDARGTSRRATTRPSATPTRRSSAPIARKSYPVPDGKLTFDKLSSVYLSGNRTRDDAPSHIRVRTRVPRRSPCSGSGCARRRSTRRSAAASR